MYKVTNYHAETKFDGATGDYRKKYTFKQRINHFYGSIRQTETYFVKKKFRYLANEHNPSRKYRFSR